MELTWSNLRRTLFFNAKIKKKKKKNSIRKNQLKSAYSTCLLEPSEEQNSADIPVSIIVTHVLPYLDRTSWNQLVTADRELYQALQDDPHILPPWPIRSFSLRRLATAVAMSPDGSTLAVATQSKKVALWHRSKGPYRTLVGHNRPVTDVAFSPDGRWLASVSTLLGDDSSIRIWDVHDNYACAHVLGDRPTLPHYIKGTCSVRFLQSTHMTCPATSLTTLVSWGYSNEIRFWDIDRGTLVDAVGLSTSNLPDTHVELNSTVMAVAVSPNRQILAYSDSDRLVQCCTIASILSRRHITSQPVTDHMEQTLTNSSETAGANITTANNEDSISTLEVHHTISTLSFTPNGDFLVIGCCNGLVEFWTYNQDKGPNAQIPKWIRAIRVSKSQYVTNLHFSSMTSIHESRIMTCTVGKKIKLYQCLWGGNFQLATTLEGHTDRVESISFFQDHKTLVSCGDKTIRFWDLSAERRLVRHPQLPEPTLVLPMSIIVQYILPYLDRMTWYHCVAAHYQLYLALKKDQDILPPWPIGLTIQSSRVPSALAVSPDGTTLAIATRSTKIQLWDQRHGPYMSLVGHTRAVTDIQYSPNGQWFASASCLDETSSIRVWNIHNKRLYVCVHVLSLERMNDGVCNIKFLPNLTFPTTLVTWGGTPTIRFWNMKGNCTSTTGNPSLVPFSTSANSDVNRIVKAITVVAFSPNGKLMAYSEPESNLIHIREVVMRTDETMNDGMEMTASDEKPTITQTWMAKDEKACVQRPIMATTSRAGTLKVTSLVSTLAFAPNDQLLMIGFRHGIIEIWIHNQEPQKQRRIQSIRVSKLQPITNLCISTSVITTTTTTTTTCAVTSARERTIVACSVGKKMKLYHYGYVPEMEEASMSFKKGGGCTLIGALQGHSDRVESFVFLNKNKALLSCCDRSIRFWDLSHA